MRTEPLISDAPWSRRRRLAIAMRLGLLAAVLGLWSPPSATAARDDTKILPPLFSPGGIVRKETGRLLIKFKRGVPESAKFMVYTRHGLVKEKDLAGIDVVAVKMPKDLSDENTTEEVVARIRATETWKGPVEWAEADALVPPAYAPNDPSYPIQWHHVKINSPTAWDSATGSGVTIAICDTGIDGTHPDLVARLVPGHNVPSNNSDTSDVHGHGTATAGTAAAVGDNALQVAGVAYKAWIMPIRVTNHPAGYAYLSDIATGITWAADHGAKVANASYQTSDSSTVRSAGNYMRSKGGLVTTSAGNYGASDGFTATPDLIVVSATDSIDTLTSWSSWGDDVDCSAPGVAILTLTRGGGIGYWSGTSFSAPMTAGVIALLFSVGNFTPAAVETFLLNGADDFGLAGWDDRYGWGRLNAGKAVQLAKAALGDVTPPTTPTNLTATSPTGTQVNLSWTASTDNVGVAGYAISRDGVEVGTGASTTYADTPVAPGTTSAYTVRAYDAAGNYSDASNAATATTPNTRVTITSYRVANKTGTTATIVWTTNVPSTGVVAYGTNAGALTLSVADPTIGTSHSTVLAGLAPLTTYYCQIAATSVGMPATTATSPCSSFRAKRK